jgi:hypothetical protein
MHAATVVVVALGLCPSDASPSPYDAPQRAEVLDHTAVARAAANPCGITELARKGVSDDIIISVIRTSGRVYHLNEQLDGLMRMHGVPDRAIRAMWEANVRHGLGAPPYVFDHGPMPPPVVTNSK